MPSTCFKFERGGRIKDNKGGGLSCKRYKYSQKHDIIAAHGLMGEG